MPTVYPLGADIPDVYPEFVRVYLQKTTKRSHLLIYYTPYDEDAEEARPGAALLELRGLPTHLATVQQGDMVQLGNLTMEGFNWSEDHRFGSAQANNPHLWAVWEIWRDAVTWRNLVRSKAGECVGMLLDGEKKSETVYELSRTVFVTGAEQREGKFSPVPFFSRVLQAIVGQDFVILPIGADDGSGEQRKTVCIPNKAKVGGEGDNPLAKYKAQGYVPVDALEGLNMEYQYADDPVVMACARREHQAVKIMNELIAAAKQRPKTKED